MKKLFFTIIVVFVTAFVAKAQIQGDLEIKKGIDIVNINGLEDDAVWAQIDPVQITNVFNYESPSVTAYFKMFYTNEYIYVLVDVTDDVHYPAWIAEDTRNEWLYDKVEVYFDVNDVLKDGNGPAYIDGYMAPGHYQMAPYLTEDGYGVPYEPTNVIYGSLTGLVTVAYTLKADDAGYVMEYRFPMYGFVNDLDEEMSVEAFKALPQGMGFDVIITDNDNDGNGRKRAVWKNIGPTEPYNNMDNCGVVVFGNENISSLFNHSVANQLKTYPSPVKDQLNIEGNYNKVIFFNSLGQTAKVVEGSLNVINVEDLSNGIYVLKAYEGGLLKGTSKIIKE